MARYRTIKPQFSTSESIAALSIPARLHFVMLWTHADDFGRGLDNPRLIKAAIWPLDDDMTPAAVDDLQAELESAGRITRYVVNNRHYFEIVHFDEHQRPQKRQDVSEYPPPPAQTSMNSSATVVLPSPDNTPTNEVTPVVSRVVSSRERVVSVKEPSTATPIENSRLQLLCERLADAIMANDPSHRKPTVTQAWLDACRLLLDRDGRTESQVEAMIDWSQQDEFWRSNVLSMPTLRRQFGKLWLQAHAPPARAGPSKNEARLGEYEQAWQKAKREENGHGSGVHRGVGPDRAALEARPKRQ